ncbi:hypothetical protein M0Q28_01195 [Patescibacteria group bacterium]|jgi:hypothetical protein|nr:hypothetical protein [Patescibacteria group bacterium]
MKKNLLIEIAGWYGALAILAAYFLGSFGVLAPTGLAYQLLNLTGAVGIIVVAAYKKVYQSVALNVVWGIIAVVAIVQLFV